MARPRLIDKGLVAQARKVVARTTDAEELRAAQAVLLPAVASATLEQTAAILGVGRATVARLQTRFWRHGERGSSRPRPWGGQSRMLLSPEQKEAFMAQWKDPAERGELVVLTPLRAALDRQVGRRVKPSVVYRLVQRHRWRKVAPDTRHPKADLQVQAQWKKKRCPKSWRPC